MTNGYIGVDLDGTLARYDGWVDAGHIGEPVPLMLDRVRAWLAAGQEVRVITARASVSGEEYDTFYEAFYDWCMEHLGQVLEVQCHKCFRMTQFWDDRAVSVRTNTGEIVGRREEFNERV